MNSNVQTSVLGNLSFKGDSFPNLSEFDSDSIIAEYKRESSSRPADGVMAPTTTIETITVTRPLKVRMSTQLRVVLPKVIAFICGLMVMVLLILALISNDWLMATGWRQGLFSYCVAENAKTPLPFNVKDLGPGCFRGRDTAYIKIAAALCIIALLTDAMATLLTGIGLRTSDHRTKYKFYRIAVYVMILSLVTVLMALVVYPVCFAAELNEGNRTIWEFGWAYGVGWGAAIFLFGAVVLLLCDKESEEIYYKERKVGGA